MPTDSSSLPVSEPGRMPEEIDSGFMKMTKLAAVYAEATPYARPAIERSYVAAGIELHASILRHISDALARAERAEAALAEALARS